MANKCSAPNCFSYYYPDDPYIPVYKHPNKPPELRQEWITALRRVNMTDLKFIFVCAKHFREDDIEHVFKCQILMGPFLKSQEPNLSYEQEQFHLSYLVLLHIIQNHQLLYIGYLLRKRSMIISLEPYS